MHTHRVKVFNRADDDKIALPVRHDLHFELFPAEQAHINQDAIHWTLFDTPRRDFTQFVWCIGDTAAAPGQRKRRAHQHGIVKRFGHAQRVVHCFDDLTRRRLEADFGHCIFEKLTVFRHFDAIRLCADEFHTVPIQHACLMQRQRQV